MVAFAQRGQQHFFGYNFLKQTKLFCLFSTGRCYKTHLDSRLEFNSMNKVTHFSVEVFYFCCTHVV